MYLVQHPGHGTSVRGVMQMENTVPRVGLEPVSLAFRVNVLPLHHIGSLMSCYTHPYLSLQLLASEVSANYYTHIYIYIVLVKQRSTFRWHRTRYL